MKSLEGYTKQLSLHSTVGKAMARKTESREDTSKTN